MAPESEIPMFRVICSLLPALLRSHEHRTALGAPHPLGVPILICPFLKASARGAGAFRLGGVPPLMSDIGTLLAVEHVAMLVGMLAARLLAASTANVGSTIDAAISYSRASRGRGIASTSPSGRLWSRPSRAA